MRPRPLSIVPAVLAASFAWLFRRALFAGETFVERDLATFHRAAKSLVPRLVHETGGLPQWNPYYASGQPFAANPQHALFHPLTALFLVLPFEWAFRAQVILPPLMAAAAMFFLLRSLGRRPWAAAFGATVWGLGGYTLSVTNLLPTLLATSVLPAVLAFACRLAHGGGRGDAVGLALTLGLEGLAGEPATLLCTPFLLIPAVGEGILRGRARLTPRRVGRLAAALALGVAVAGATLLPASRLAVRTNRAAALPAAMADIWSMPPLRLAELVSPYAFGRVETGAWGFWGLRFYPGQTTPFLYSLYPGLITTVLAGAGALGALRGARRRRFRPALLWMGAGAVGVVLAAGRFLPLWPIVRHLPLLRGVRYPERFVLIALLPLVVLAALGFDRLIRGSPAALRWARGGLLAAGALFAVAGVVAVASGPGLWTALGVPRDAAAQVRLLSAQDALVGLLTALAFLVAVDARARRWPWVPAALITLAAADLTHAGGRLMRTLPAKEMTTPPPVLRPLLEEPAWGSLFHAAGWVAQHEREFSFVRPPMPAFWGIPTAFEPDFDLTELRWSTMATGAFLEVLETQPRAAFAAARRRGVAAVVRLRTLATNRQPARLEEHQHHGGGRLDRQGPGGGQRRGAALPRCAAAPGLSGPARRGGAGRRGMEGHGAPSGRGRDRCRRRR